MNNYVDLPEEGGAGSGVSSLNGLSGALNLVAGTGIAITPAGSTILIASTSSGGTVTSVGLVDSTGVFNITGSPVTSAGNLTLSSLKSQSANTFLAAPNGSAGSPTFRLIVSADIPTLNQNTTGTAANITATSNSTLVTLSSLSLPYSQVTGAPAAGISSLAPVGATPNANAATISGTTLNLQPANPGFPGVLTAGNQNIGGLKSVILADNTSFGTINGGRIANSTDTTKMLAYNLSGSTTGATLTIATTQSTSETLQIPNITGSDVLATLGLSQTFTGTNTFSNPISGSVTGTSANVTGVVAIANGGTGQTTAPNAINALLPSQTGNAGQVLSTNGTVAAWTPVTGTGTVTSVALALPAGVFSVSGSPVTTAGTLTGAFTVQSANTIFAGPTSGGSSTPAFRGLVSADIPNNAASTTGTASNITATSNSTLTTLSALSLPGAQVTGNISGNAANITATSNSTLTTLSALSLPTSQLSGTVSLTTQVSGVLPVANGGTALSTTPTNGQLLIGNGTNYTLGTITAGNGIAVANASGSITISTTSTFAQVSKTANYTILSTDSTIFCNTSGGAFTLTLPSPTALAGKLYRIIDTGGTFQSNNLTLAPSASEMIEGLAASKLLQTNWGWFNVTTDGTNWFVG